MYALLLDDGDTWGGLDKCTIVRIPDDPLLDHPLEHGEVIGRFEVKDGEIRFYTDPNHNEYIKIEGPGFL